MAALVAGIFALLPRLCGLTRDADALRHARPALAAASIVAQAASLACYALLYRRVLASLGARVSFPLAARVVMSSFLMSHLTPFGSVTGTVVNASTLEDERGIPPATTTDAIGVTSLVSVIALITLFGAGFAATAGRHLSRGYVTVVAIALVLTVSGLALTFVAGSHPAIAERAGRWAGRLARRFRRDIDPEAVAQNAARIVSLTRSALTGRRSGRASGSPRATCCSTCSPST